MGADFFNLFLQQLKKIPKTSHYVVGFSGGLDSTVLLHLMWRWCQENHIALTALHIHHGIHAQADLFEKHAEQFCQHFSISFLSKRVKVNISSQSLEAAARQARYAACESSLNHGEILLFAHHAQDQAETVLLQLLRGSGVRGLAAMPMIRRFGKGLLARPLLAFSRDDMLIYANANQLNWIEDDSNQQIHLSRNFLRKEIFPKLKAHWADPVSALCQSAKHCASAQQNIDEFMRDYYLKSEFNLKKNVDNVSLEHSNVISHIFSYATISEKPISFQLECLRSWIYFNEFCMPPKLKLENFLKQIQVAGMDRFPLMKWGECEIRKYGHQLFLMKSFPSFDLQTTQEKKPIVWKLGENQKVFLGQCKSKQSCAQTHSRFYISARIKQIDIRFRQEGAQIKLNQHRQSLKNLFQRYRVPPWLRSHLPLLYIQEECVGILGVVLSHSIQAKLGEEAWYVDFSFDESTHEFREMQANLSKPLEGRE